MATDKFLLLRDGGHHYQVIRCTLNDAEKDHAEVIHSFADDRFNSSVRFVDHCRKAAENDLEKLIGECVPVMLP